MTLPRLYALSAQWNRCPPLRFMVAGLVGIKPSAGSVAAGQAAAAEPPEFEP